MPTRDGTDFQERTSLHQELEVYQDFSVVVVIFLCVYIYKSRIIQNHISPHYKQILKKFLGFWVFSFTKTTKKELPNSTPASFWVELSLFLYINYIKISELSLKKANCILPFQSSNNFLSNKRISSKRTCTF